jgi:hypothetical protein
VAWESRWGEKDGGGREKVPVKDRRRGRDSTEGPERGRLVDLRSGDDGEGRA